MSGARKYAVNTAWLFSGRALQIGLSFFVGVWAVRYLGPADYGNLSYAASLIGMLAPLAVPAVDAILVRELHRHRDAAGEWLGSAFVLRLIAGSLLWIGLMAMVLFQPMAPEIRILLLLISPRLFAPSAAVTDSWFQMNVTAKYTVEAKAAGLLFTSMAKVALVLLHAPVVFFAAVLSIDALVVSLALIWNYRRLGGRISVWHWRRATAQKLLVASWPMWLTGLAVAAYLKIDQIMLKQMMGSEAVGQYGAVVRMSEMLYFIPMALTTTFYPAILAAREAGAGLYHERLQHYYDLMVGLGLALALVMAGIGPWLVGLLYGAEFAPAAALIRWHAPHLLFVFMAQAGSRWFLAEEKQMALLAVSLIGAASNIVLNFFLIPDLGLKGAALATVISYGIAAYGAQAVWPGCRENFGMLSASLNLRAAIRRTRSGLDDYSIAQPAAMRRTRQMAPLRPARLMSRILDYLFKRKGS